MIGYFKDPERTAETKKDGWIYTGDIGYQDEEGYFFFVGRKKEVIRRRGELISPTEIESVINSHPSVQESAVIGVPSGLGSGEEEVKAYVCLKPDENGTPQEILSWCKEKLAEFKIPRFLEFRTDFPKSAIGRIQKNLLKTERQDLTERCYDRLKEEENDGEQLETQSTDERNLRGIDEMEKDVAIVGVGQSPFMRRCGVSIGELCFWAYQEAMEGIRLKNEEIDASVVCSATEYDKQRSPAGVVSDYLNLRGKPTFCVESLCSSSSSGLRVAYSLIKAGLHRCRCRDWFPEDV